jgi:hypothetical protein
MVEAAVEVAEEGLAAGELPIGAATADWNGVYKRT